jgi:hypothetical protein
LSILPLAINSPEGDLTRKRITPTAIASLGTQIKSGKWSKGSLLSATVQDGIVKSWGVVDSEAE